MIQIYALHILQTFVLVNLNIFNQDACKPLVETQLAVLVLRAHMHSTLTSFCTIMESIIFPFGFPVNKTTNITICFPFKF